MSKLIPDPDAYWKANKRSKPLPEIKPPHNHTLTHNPFTHRWSCKCGYVLGDGRERLLAPCPLALKRQQKRPRSNEFTRTVEALALRTLQRKKNNNNKQRKQRKK